MLKDLSYITSGACDLVKKGVDATDELVNRVPRSAKGLVVGVGATLLATSAQATDTAAATMVTSAITELGERATQVGQLGVAVIAVVAVMGVIGLVTGFLKRR